MPGTLKSEKERMIKDLISYGKKWEENHPVNCDEDVTEMIIEYILTDRSRVLDEVRTALHTGYDDEHRIDNALAKIEELKKC